jgi:hypothetical protein
VTVFRKRPTLGTFVVMFVVNVAYFGYGAGFALIRATKSATSVACSWPYPEAKVYDPNGFYEEAGQPGRFYPGIWAGWPSAQCDRPDVDPPGRRAAAWPAVRDRSGCETAQCSTGPVARTPARRTRAAGRVRAAQGEAHGTIAGKACMCGGTVDGRRAHRGGGGIRLLGRRR